MAEGDPQLRIGELSRRVDVEPALLRAWEKRYGLLNPIRSEGNYRLYSNDDVDRVRAMKAHLARGLAAAEAARLALADPMQAASPEATEASDMRLEAEALQSALRRLDEREAHELLDRAFALNSLEDVLSGVVLPCLRDIGDGWERGTISVAQEHFASTLLRARLLAISRGWASGGGPAAALACPPGEQHDIGLIAFGLVLWRLGWRVIYIGQDTPVEELRSVASSVRPKLVAVAASEPTRFEDVAEELSSLASQAPLAIAGAGASVEIAVRLDGVLLDRDPVSAARAVNATSR